MWLLNRGDHISRFDYVYGRVQVVVYRCPKNPCFLSLGLNSVLKISNKNSSGKLQSLIIQWKTA